MYIYSFNSNILVTVADTSKRVGHCCDANIKG